MATARRLSEEAQSNGTARKNEKYRESAGSGLFAGLLYFVLLAAIAGVIAVPMMRGRERARLAAAKTQPSLGVTNTTPTAVVSGAFGFKLGDLLPDQYPAMLSGTSAGLTWDFPDNYSRYDQIGVKPLFLCATISRRIYQIVAACSDIATLQPVVEVFADQYGTPSKVTTRTQFDVMDVTFGGTLRGAKRFIRVSKMSVGADNKPGRYWIAYVDPVIKRQAEQDAKAATALASAETAKMTERLWEQAEYIPTQAERMALYNEKVRLAAEQRQSDQKRANDRELAELELLHDQKLISGDEYFKRSQALSLKAADQKRQAEMEELYRKIDEKTEAIKVAQGMAEEGRARLKIKKAAVTRMNFREEMHEESLESLKKSRDSLEKALRDVGR